MPLKIVKTLQEYSEIDMNMKLYKISETISVAKLDNCGVYTDLGFVLTEKKVVLNPSPVYYSLGIKDCPLYLNATLPKPSYLFGNSVLLTSYYNDTYYHWFFDILPRLYYYHKLGVKIDNYILPKFEFPYQEESIKMLGIEESKIKFIDEKTYFIAEKLYITDSSASLLNDTSEILAYFKQFFKPKNPKNKDRIYISREGATIRKVKCEDEFVECIKKDGFEKIIFQKMSLQEQIDTIYNAKIILVPHGAGCTNIIFAKEPEALIEIFPGRVTFKGYRSFCKKVGIPYFYTLAKMGREYIDFDSKIMHQEVREKIGHLL